MEDEVYSQEDLLLDESSDEDVLSSADDLTKISEKLDRFEALLNEDIALRLTTESGYDFQTFDTTSSGVQDPNYNQYIYDMLTDGVINVQIVDDQSIFDKQLNDYTVGESISLITLILGFLVFVAFVINRYTPKRR